MKARMLGVCGMAGTGCSPKCRRTHKPSQKRDKGAQRSYEKGKWRKSISKYLSR